MRGVVIVSGVAYGDGGGGFPGLLLGSPRNDAGNLIMLGTGQQHWSTVHVADLADLFRRVLEDDSARGLYVIGDGAESDRRRAHRGGRRRGRRSGRGSRLRRRGSGTPGRLLRRGPPPRSGEPARPRLQPSSIGVPPSGTGRRVPQWELPQRKGRRETHDNEASFGAATTRRKATCPTSPGSSAASERRVQRRRRPGDLWGEQLGGVVLRMGRPPRRHRS